MQVGRVEVSTPYDVRPTFGNNKTSAALNQEEATCTTTARGKLRAGQPVTLVPYLENSITANFGNYSTVSIRLAQATRSAATAAAGQKTKIDCRPANQKGRTIYGSKME